MAIGRVSGSMLVSNLDRQGTDLQFTTNSQPLVYMNFSQFKLGVNTSTLSETLTINGNLSTSNVLINGLTISAKSGNLSVGSPISLGAIGDVHISGGAANYIIATDGNGNLSFIDANASPGIAAIEANIGAYQLWANANVGAIYTHLSTLDANVGAYEIYANANIGTIYTHLNTLDANVGAFELYANANIGTIYTHLNTLDANVGAFEIYANANIGTIYTHLNTLDANVGAYEIYANANIGTIYTHLNTLDANVGAFELYANANLSTQTTNFNTLNANVGAYQIWANANLSTQTTNFNTLNANVGAYQIWANANASSQASSINAINANVSAANVAIATLQTQVYSNANVASYLTVFNGNINAGNINLSGNLHTDYISPNVNSVVSFTGTTAIKLPVGDNSQRPSGVAGDFRYNTQSGAPEYYNGASWIPVTNTVTDQIITGDDVNTVYTLDQVATNVGTLVSINGTLQQPGVAYNISGNQITFAEVMLSSDIIDIRYLGGIVSFSNQLNDDLTISGNLTVNGNLSYNNFYYGNILPQTTLVSNIGSTAKQFNTIFASNVTVANIATVGGNLTVNGAAGVITPNRPAFRVYGSSSSDISSGSTITATQGATIDYNQGSYYNNSTGIFTAPVAGIYSAKLNLRVGSNNGLNQAAISKNNSTSGANVIAFWETDTNTGTASHFGVSGDCYLAAGDTIRIKVVAGKVQFDVNDSWSVTYIG